MTNQELEQRGYEITWDGRLEPRTPVTPEPLPDNRLLALPYRKRDQALIAAEVAAIVACLEKQPCSRRQLRRATGLSEQSVSVAVNRLKREGRIEAALYGSIRLVVSLYNKMDGDAK